jgi:hypothetical protein
MMLTLAVMARLVRASEHAGHDEKRRRYINLIAGWYYHRRSRRPLTSAVSPSLNIGGVAVP